MVILCYMPGLGGRGWSNLLLSQCWYGRSHDIRQLQQVQQQCLQVRNVDI